MFSACSIVFNLPTHRVLAYKIDLIYHCSEHDYECYDTDDYNEYSVGEICERMAHNFLTYRLDLSVDQSLTIYQAGRGEII